MVVHKRKKVKKYRGLTTHGGGARKKRRGAGSRGGRGNAGTGKRAGHKKAGVCKQLGQRGFTSKTNPIIREKVVNLSYFTPDRIKKMLNQKEAVKEKDIVIIDLEQLGYKKLLSTGNLEIKIKFIVKKYSAGAEEKVKAAGGQIVSPSEAAKKEDA